MTPASTPVSGRQTQRHSSCRGEAACLPASLGGHEEESQEVPCPGPCTHADYPTEAELICETHYISLPPVPCYRKGCFTGSLLLHQLQGRKYFDAIKILLVFLLPPHPCKTGKHDTLPFMVMKDPDEGSSCSQTIVLTILTQDFPTAHCLKKENALYALSVYLQGRQSRQLLTESGH